MLHPERSILVEGGNAFLRGDELCADGRADKVHGGLLGGSSFHEGSGSWAQTRVWPASATTSKAKGMAEELHIELLRLLEGRIASRALLPALVYSSICRELPNVAFHCLLRGDLDLFVG